MIDEKITGQIIKTLRHVTTKCYNVTICWHCDVWDRKFTCYEYDML